jgi:hypothetical protein
MARTDFHKVMIGRAELLAFVEPPISDVPAKTDTGAYHSAVHADNISLSKDGNTLHFRLLGGHPLYGNAAVELTTDMFEKAEVANSFGHSEERYAVRLRVKLGPKVFTAAFTLADRSMKLYPILLGRKLLNNRFVVDSAKTSVDRLALKKKFGINTELPLDEEEGKQ